MSATLRWIVAILLIGLGFMLALIALAFLGFFTWNCDGTSNSIAYGILYVAAAVSLIGGLVPAVMLIRNAAGKYFWTALAISLVLNLASYGAFIYYTGNLC